MTITATRTMEYPYGTRKARTRKTAGKAKNKILLAITLIAILCVLCGISLVDEGCFKAGIALTCAGFTWIGLFTYANQGFRRYWE